MPTCRILLDIYELGTLKYGSRLIFMKRVPIELYGNKGFAYVTIDAERQKEEQRNYINRALDDPKKKKKMSDEAMNFLGCVWKLGIA
jgi:hypothetical protein